MKQFIGLSLEFDSDVDFNDALDELEAWLQDDNAQYYIAPDDYESCVLFIDASYFKQVKIDLEDTFNELGIYYTVL